MKYIFKRNWRIPGKAAKVPLAPLFSLGCAYSNNSGTLFLSHVLDLKQKKILKLSKKLFINYFNFGF